jgi:hypothetical protein
MTGPCPACKTLFQVPYPTSLPIQGGREIQPFDPYQQLPPYVPPHGYSSPVPQSSPLGTYYMTPEGLCYLPNVMYPAQAPHPAAYLHPYPPTPPARPAPAPAAVNRKAWPNPSNFPSKPATSIIRESANTTDADSDSTNQQRKAPRAASAKRSILPLVFFVSVLCIIFGIHKTLKKGKSDSKLGNSLTAKAKAAPKEIADTLGNPPNRHPANDRLDLATLEPPPSLPEGMPAAVRGKAAIDLLEKFFATKTLAERLPLIETETPETELAASVLAGPLPPVVFLELETTESNPIEQLTDYYHSVNFQLENGQVVQQTILVRSRGGIEPKVIIDPFLDTFGGRLAAFAKAPVEKSGVFRVIISPIASCNDEKIPSPEKKMTMKLLARDGTKEISRAYFSRQSKIAQMLEDGTYDFNFSSTKACTVMFRWNTEENSDMPYLEALSLKALNWNP